MRIKRVAVASVLMTALIAGVMTWDYTRVNGYLDTAATLLKSGRRIDFNPGSAVVHATGETIVLKTLNRFEQAGSNTVSVIFRSPIFGFEKRIVYTAAATDV